MKTLSVLLTFVLLLGATHLASRLRRANALPAGFREAAPAEYSRAAARSISTFHMSPNPQVQ